MDTVASLIDSVVAHGIPDRPQAERTLRATLSVLGERLSDDEAAALGKALPAELARLVDQSEYDSDFSAADFYERTRRRLQASAGLTTLATGRPGSRHPLSESPPPAGHTHSAARSDDPHAETKLSSARGLTQERHDESLSTGRPPQPAHPVSGTSD
jgi:hypothetical protein